MRFAATGRQSDSALFVGVHPNTISITKKEDPEFKHECEVALALYCDVLEEEAHRRAVLGVSRPVFYKGEVCGTIQEYSDQILLAMLKKNIAAYRDKQQIDITHTGGVLVVPGTATDEATWEKEHGRDKSENAQ